MLEYLPIFIALFILIALIFLIAFKSNKNIQGYDERQLIARNTAYKWAVAALAVYFVSSELITLILEYDWCTPYCNIGLGMFFSIGTFIVISILKDAYTPIGGNVAKSLIIFVVLGGYQLFMGISDVFESGIMLDNQLNLSVPLCVGMLFVVILITQLIKLAIDKKSAKDED